MKPLSGIRIGTKISLAVSVVLFTLLLAGAGAISYGMYTDFRSKVVEESRQLLTTIRTVHTQAMLSRVSPLSEGPAIEAFNKFIRELYGVLDDTTIWMVQGPKVLAYQKQQGEYLEPPLDAVDRKALTTKRTVEEWDGYAVFRITEPVIMGWGEAANPACATCHTQNMGAQEGEPLGAYSIRIELKSRWDAFTTSATSVFVLAFGVALLVSAFTAFLLHRAAGRPLAVMTGIMNRLAAGDVDTKVPELDRADEIGDMARALNVFKDNAIHRLLAEESLSDSEKRMQDILNNLVDGVLVIDPGGIVHFYNRAAEEIFGYAPNEVIGKTINGLMPEPYSSQHDQYLTNYVTTGKARIIGIGREVVGLRKNGEEFPLDLSVTESRIEGKSYFTGVVRDITERKNIEKTLLHAKEEAEAASIAKSEFLANMSHELRTPLNAIIGFSEATLSGVFGKIQPAQYEDYLVSIRESGQHLLDIISQILDISKIEKGTLDITPEEFNLETTIKEAAKSTAPMIAKEGNAFTVECPEDLIMYSDPVRLRQIVMNLLSNAAKFTESGTIHLTVTTEDHNGTPFVAVTVTDTGIGVAREQQDLIFEPFIQGDLSVRKKYGGTGLGLAISRELAQLMGGDLIVESALGKGSAFTLSLPLRMPTLET